MMTLSAEDGELFLQLWFPLLDYVNRKFKLVKHLKKITISMNLEPEDIRKITDKLNEDLRVIDEYLAAHKELPEEHKEIITSWKKGFYDRFIVERHLKSGSIFIATNNAKFYKVLGITDSIEELLRYGELPLVVQTTLIPFKNVIITNGLVVPYDDFYFGGNIRRSFKDEYISAKKRGEVITSL